MRFSMTSSPSVINVNNSNPPPVAPVDRRLEINSDITAQFGDYLVVDTSAHDVTVTMPAAVLGQKEITILKNDATAHVVHVVGTVNGIAGRDIGDNEALNLMPTSSGYVII